MMKLPQRTRPEGSNLEQQVFAMHAYTVAMIRERIQELGGGASQSRAPGAAVDLTPAGAVEDDPIFGPG
jgi:hypothetical protein